MKLADCQEIGKNVHVFFVEDFDMYSNVWAGEMPFRAVDDKIYEYACHEGNYAMANILAGAREEDRRK